MVAFFAPFRKANPNAFHLKLSRSKALIISEFRRSSSQGATRKRSVSKDAIPVRKGAQKERPTVMSTA